MRPGLPRQPAKINLSAGLPSAPYLAGLREGWSWVAAFGLSLGVILTRRTPARVVDDVGCKFVQQAFENEERRYKVVLAILALQKKLRLSGALLRGTWSALQTWGTLMPSTPRVPLTLYVLQAILCVALSWGYKETGRERRLWWGAAFGWMVSFVGLLRPGEMIALKKSDVVLPHGPDPGVVLVIQNPKTRRIWRKQFVLITETWVCDWIQWWCRPLRSS
jgi:hypothetical protein